jgi:hypothetical protein
MSPIRHTRVYRRLAFLAAFVAVLLMGYLVPDIHGKIDLKSAWIMAVCIAVVFAAVEWSDRGTPT